MGKVEAFSVEAISEPRAYWPPEDSGVMPAEITSEHRRELPPCRPGWPAPGESSEECRVCGRALTAADIPFRVEIPPGAVEGLMRVLADGARTIGNAARSDSTLDDLSIAASVMSTLVREQKARSGAG
jgi:hypothetical protein